MEMQEYLEKLELNKRALQDRIQFESSSKPYNTASGSEFTEIKYMNGDESNQIQVLIRQL
jgi:hypothetical protein